MRSTAVKEIWVGFRFEVDLSVNSIQIVGFSLSSFSQRKIEKSSLLPMTGPTCVASSYESAVRLKLFS